MAARTAVSSDRAAVLRRQPNDIVWGQVAGGYANQYEVICLACGDVPEVEYRDTPPRIQRLRGPYRLMQGVAAYQAHVDWHDQRGRRERLADFAKVS